MDKVQLSRGTEGVGVMVLASPLGEATIFVSF
jgi:hypothetical protein